MQSVTFPPSPFLRSVPLKKGVLRSALVLSALVTLSACATSGSGGGRGGALPNDIPSVGDPAPFVSGTMRPYTVRGRTYRPAEQPDYDESGQASWYGQYHHGRSTSTGERFDMNALTAAHKTLPLPSMVEVTNPANGRRVLLRVNDRGPFVDSRIIDLSRGAADALGLLNQGVGEVRVRYAGRAPRSGGGTRLADVGSRGSRQPVAPPVQTVASAPSSTARPYDEVVREQPRVQPRTQTRPQASQGSRVGSSTNYPRTRRDVPIPDQPLPPLMPPKDAALVTPAAPPASAPVPQVVPVPVANYRVQVITFDERAFAEGVARRLGEGAVVEPFERNGRTIYRVVSGAWSSREAAESARQAIIARGFADALLIAY